MRAGAVDDDGPDSTGGSDRDDEADPESVARTIALRQLTVRARTRHELATTLARREVPAEAAEVVLDRLGDVGLVDDEQFARDWVASRQTRRHLSRSALRRELRAKGVDRDIVEDALAETTTDERAIAQELAERKLRSMSGLTPDVQARRLAGMLARRGFSHAVVSGVLASVRSSAEFDHF